MSTRIEAGRRSRRIVPDFVLPASRPSSEFRPRRLSFDPEGNVTLLGLQEDHYYYENRVYKYTPEGEFIARWNFSVLETGSSCSPADLAWDPAGHLYLSDSAVGCAGVRVYGYGAPPEASRGLR